MNTIKFYKDGEVTRVKTCQPTYEQLINPGLFKRRRHPTVHEANVLMTRQGYTRQP